MGGWHRDGLGLLCPDMISFSRLSRGPLLLKNTMLSGELLLQILWGRVAERQDQARGLGSLPTVRLLGK